ncbi:hypothetical protein ACVWWO_008806 [Bradyrhizobium sp. F1.13.1]
MGLFFRFFVGGAARPPATPPLGGIGLAYSDRVAPKKSPASRTRPGVSSCDLFEDQPRVRERIMKLS